MIQSTVICRNKCNTTCITFPKSCAYHRCTTVAHKTGFWGKCVSKTWTTNQERTEENHDQNCHEYPNYEVLRNCAKTKTANVQCSVLFWMTIYNEKMKKKILDEISLLIHAIWDKILSCTQYNENISQFLKLFLWYTIQWCLKCF